MASRLLSLVPALVAAAAAIAVLGCAGERVGNGRGRGTVVIATAADADVLLPTLVQQLVAKQVVDQLFEPLAAPPASMSTVGDAGYEPRLAARWTWAPDSLSIAFAIDPRARWHDGRPVTSRDVRFSLELLKDPRVGAPLGESMSNVDSVSTPDSLTAVAWFARRSPEQFFTFVYNLPVVPEHLLAGVPRDKLGESPFARAPVGNGRFRFKRWERGKVIEVVADTANYRGRPSIDRVMWSVSPDPTAMWARLVNEEADVVEMLRGEPLAKVAASTTTRPVPYQGLDYAFVTFNTRARGRRQPPHPVLGSAAVRRALALGVDRQAIARNVFDTLAYLGIGPVVRAQWTADTAIAIPAHDAAAAMALLDSLGWRDLDGNGVREKGGRPLAFSLAVPTSSAPRRQASVLLQAQWKAIGADVTIEELEFNAFVERLMSGRFDAAMNGSHANPSPSDVRTMYGSDRTPDRQGGNFGGYASATVDALLDSAVHEFDAQRARSMYRRAYARIIADAAAVFLYEPRMVAGINNRIDPGTLPAVGWWIHLADWRIEPARRIARDRIPLDAPVAGGRGASPGDSAG
ncbi:MAG TPA: peptide ABC transporter substrate-binding protein [Gemmatimonadaceae bacterium]|nr:peptide ABC transporter substrate-binding protein [Gemmatimonadaceae bacterium]